MRYCKHCGRMVRGHKRLGVLSWLPDRLAVRRHPRPVSAVVDPVVPVHQETCVSNLRGERSFQVCPAIGTGGIVADD